MKVLTFEKKDAPAVRDAREEIVKRLREWADAVEKGDNDEVITDPRVAVLIFQSGDSIQFLHFGDAISFSGMLGLLESCKLTMFAEEIMP